MAPRYVGVTHPKSRTGWVAQHASPRLFKSGFATEEQAAKWLAKTLRVRQSSLLRFRRSRVRRQLVLSNFRGVVRRCRPQKSVLWEARRPGGVLLGTYSSELHAAKALARVLGVPVSSLRRKAVLTRRIARQLFIAAYRVFKKYIPGDVEKTCEHERKYRTALKQDSLVYGCM